MTKRICGTCGADISEAHFNRRFCDGCRTPAFKNRRLKERNPEYFYNASLRRHYGITREEYDRLGDSQGWVCAICSSAPSGVGNGGRLVVDHCHRTSRVRALLCSPCNKGIGHLRDDLRIAERAVMYLREHAA